MTIKLTATISFIFFKRIKRGEQKLYFQNMIHNNIKNNISFFNINSEPGKFV